MRTKFEEWMSLHRRTFKLLGNTVSMHQHRDGRLSGLLHSNDHEMAIWRHASASAIWTFAMFQLNNSKFSQACRVVRAKIEETLGILSNYGAKELGHIYVQLFTTKPSWLYKHISLSLSLAKHFTPRPSTDGHETTSQKKKKSDSIRSGSQIWPRNMTIIPKLPTS